jgi:hypothetical protein
VQHPQGSARLALVGQPQAGFERDRILRGKCWRTGRTARSSSR